MSTRRRAGKAAWVLSLAVLAAWSGPGDEPLLEATRQGDVAAVRALLASGADPDGAAGDGMTALHLAAERGAPEIAELLIAAGADVEAKTRIGQYRPLHLAGRGGHADVVRALLEAGGDPAAVTTNSGVTPLHLASMAVGGEKAVALLLEHGAPVNARETSAGQTSLMFAASYGRAAAVRELLEHGADPAVRTEVVDVLQRVVTDREANRVLRDAVRQSKAGTDGTGDVERAGESKAPRTEPSPAELQAAIAAQRAFLRSHPDAGEVRPEDLASTRTDYPGGPEIPTPPYRQTLVGKTGGMTALLHAAREGRIEAAEALLDGGADIDQVSADGTSPLLIATLNGQFDLAMMLVERGADPDLAAYTDGASPLFAVLQTQWAPKSNYPQPRAHDNQETVYLELLRALLAAGADPNVRLNTHLWYWEFGLTKIGIDLTGATPFWRAAFAQDLEAMRALVAHGADPNVPTRWPAVGMRERRQQDGRQQEDSGLPWIPEGEPNAYPLHAAAGGGWTGLGAFSVRQVPNQFLAAVKYLVEEHGADVNLRDSWGYTPLHYAASRGDDDLIRYLVARGGDVRAITRLGQSTADMTRGGRAGFFTRVAYPETEALLVSLGSTRECLHTHFRDTGDFCPGAGVESWLVEDDVAPQPAGDTAPGR